MVGLFAWAGQDCQELLVPGATGGGAGAPKTMAMPYRGGARLDMESPTPSGRRSPGTPTCFQQVGTAKAPQPFRLEPDGQGAFSMRASRRVGHRSARRA